jgi:hypothetical protein
VHLAAQNRPGLDHVWSSVGGAELFPGYHEGAPEAPDSLSDVTANVSAPPVSIPKSSVTAVSGVAVVATVVDLVGSIVHSTFAVLGAPGG